MFKVSEFCHVIFGESNFSALYNSLSSEIIILSKNEGEIINNLKPKVFPKEKLTSIINDDTEIINKLQKLKMIFRVGENDENIDYLNIRKNIGKPQIGLLYLLLTDNCNLTCDHCFISNGMTGNHIKTNMTLETAIFGIDTFIRNLDKSIEQPKIYFFGGEPFINLSILKDSISYINKKVETNELPSDTLIIIVTNGTLINIRDIDFFKSIKNLILTFSIDGKEQCHNSKRKYVDGSGSFYDALHGYTLAKKNNINCGISCTISEENIDEIENICTWFINDLKINSLGLNLMIGKHQNNELAQKSAEKIIACFKIFRSKGIFEERIMRIVTAFINKFFVYQNCGGYGQQIIVSPNGMIGPCHGFWGENKYFIEPDMNFTPKNHPIWKEWNYRSPIFMPQCRNCIALGICGGGCAYNAYINRGNIWELDDVYCTHAKMTLDFLVNDLVSKTMSK